MRQLLPLLYLSLLVVLAACTTRPPNVPPPVDETASFMLKPEFNSLRFFPDGSGTVGIDVLTSGDFGGSVELSVENLPPQVDASFLPSASVAPTTDKTDATLALDGSGVAPGIYELLVRGESGQSSDAFNFGLIVLGGNSSGNSSISGSLVTDNFLELYSLPSPDVFVNAFLPLEKAKATPEHVPGQLLVQLVPTTRIQVATGSLVADYGLTVVRQGDGLLPMLVSLPEDQSVQEMADQLERDPRVAYAEPNYLIYSQSIPNDTYIEELWHLPTSGLPVAWSLENSARSVVVAVIDTEIDLAHPDLQGVFVTGGYDFCAAYDADRGCYHDDSNPGVDDESSFNPHGTHVVGTLAAVGNNGRGVAGVLHGGATVLPVKVFASGQTTADALVRAILYSAGVPVSGVPTNPNPAQVINLSLGTRQPSEALQNAVNRVQDEGVLIVASAGNDGTPNVRAPASYEGVLSVGSISSEFIRSCFSNFGEGIDLMAAGGEFPIDPSQCDQGEEYILSTYPNDNYGLQVGTSHATPIVTGAAALVWSQLADPSPEKVTQILKGSAFFDEVYMTEDEYGAGILRVDAALGLPGPGDLAGVTAEGIDNNNTRVTSTELTLDGSSLPYTIGNLAAGAYVVEAVAVGVNASLVGQEAVTLGVGDEADEVTVAIEVP